MQQLALYFRESWLQSDSLRSRFARGVVWLMASSASAQFSALFASICAARLLGPEGFGQLGLIRSTVLMLGTVAGAGLGMAATKCVAEYRRTAPLRAGSVIGLLLSVALLFGLTTASVCLVMADPLAAGMLNQAALAGPLRLSCIMILLSAASAVALGALSGLEAFRSVALLSMVEAILNITLISLGAWFAGLIGAVAGSVLVTVVVLALRYLELVRQCRREGIPIRFASLRAEMSLLGRFALPAIAVQFAAQPFEWLARMNLARQEGGFEQLGIFTAAFSLGQIVSFLPQQVIGASAPLLSSQFAAGNLASFRRLVTASIASSVGAALTVALPFACGAPYIMAAYGSSFASGWLTLLLVLAAYTLAAGTLAFKTTFVASGHVWAQVRYTLVYGAALFIGALLLAPYGASGVAGAYLIAHLLLFLMQAIVIRMYGPLAVKEEVRT